jgi:NAD-reducing hydrogenase large subunit
MPKIAIEPVSRIEGHGKISLFTNDAGDIVDARFQVTQIRGVEHFAVGRLFTEMPELTSRICGICPVSHQLASAKACDQILAIAVPETAVRLRRLLNLGQLIQSHALSYFFLAAPDLLLGMEHPPETRHFFALAQTNPEFTGDGIRLRQFGQTIIERLAGRRIHPHWVVPGGVLTPLADTTRNELLRQIPAVRDIATRHLASLGDHLGRHADSIESFANFPSLFLALANEQGTLEHYDGSLRIIDAHGTTLENRTHQHEYTEIIDERSEPWTFLKFPYYVPMGYPDGMYRVGPLARINSVGQCGTPLADRALAQLRAAGQGPMHAWFYSHFARLIEMMFALEMVEQLLQDSVILDPRVRARAGVNRPEGVGIIEAPRGTVLHHYRVNGDGIMEWMRLIVATGHNNLAMNQGVLQVARRVLQNGALTEGSCNRIEAVIRTFDPCLSCSTHAVGRMPLIIELIAGDGEVVERMVRA